VPLRFADLRRQGARAFIVLRVVIGPVVVLLGGEAVERVGDRPITLGRRVLAARSTGGR
jgi:hypothetical protein